MCKDNTDLYKQRFSEILQHLVTTPYEQADYAFVEGILTFFYNSAYVLKEEFAEVFPNIIENIFSVAGSLGQTNLEKEPGEIDLESDDEDYDEYRNMSMSFIQAKSAALKCIGTFCEQCPMSFQGYFERCQDLIDDNANHAHEAIRHQSL